MTNLEYALIERERRWLLAAMPTDVVGDVVQIRDRYLTGTRLRLREVTSVDGSVVRKLGHKVRLADGPQEVACTSLYLDDAEWEGLAALPSARLDKRRTRFTHGEITVVLDEFEGPLTGLVLAEIDSGTGPGHSPPAGWPVVAEVTQDEAYTGAGLAAAQALPGRAD